MIKAFISHSTKNKIEAINLSNALKKYNVNAFVAHEHIECNDDWLKTIKQKLEETDIAIALITEDFNKSAFCQQEVGYILGKKAKLISVMLEDSAPQALIGDKQGIKVNLAFRQLLKSDLKYIPNDDCLKKILKTVMSEEDYAKYVIGYNEIDDYIERYASSETYKVAKENYINLKSTVERRDIALNQNQIDTIVDSFNNNNQLEVTQIDYKGKNQDIATFLNNQYKKLKAVSYNAYFFNENTVKITKTEQS